MKKLMIIPLLLILLSSCSSTEEQKVPSPVYAADVLGVSIEIARRDSSYLISIPSQMIYMLPLSETEDGSYTLGNTGICISGDLAGNAVYSQGSFTDNIEFTKIADDADIYYARPQEESIRAYPVTELEVPLRDGGILSGCITAIDSDRSRTAVIMITGSGTQDRWETSAGHRPFYVIANTLAAEGYAVLTCDDRGFNADSIWRENETTFTLSEDVRDEIAYMRKLGYSRIVLIGHSEGGIIAPMAADEAGVEAIVLMAAPAVSGLETMLSQNRIIIEKSGVPAAQAELLLTIVASMIEAAGTGDYDTFIQYGMAIYGDKTTADVQWNSLTLPWTKAFNQLDPAVYLENLKVPVLVLQGMKDTQVDPALNRAPMEEALKQSGTFYKESYLEGLNHMFQHADTGLASEYLSIHETIAPEALDAITSFLKEVL